MCAVFRRPRLDDTAAVRGPALLPRVDAQNDRQLVHLELRRLEGGEIFRLDAQAVTAARVLLLESLKARLLRITQSSYVAFRERIGAQQLTLLAFPNFAVPEIVLAAARSDKWQLELLPAALLQNVTRQIVFTDAMRDDHDATFFRMVQTSLDLVVKKLIDTLQTLCVVAVFNFHRVWKACSNHSLRRMSRMSYAILSARSWP